MRDATAALDAMAVEQSAPARAPPWKDGEHDEARAEAANDRGMRRTPRDVSGTRTPTSPKPRG